MNLITDDVAILSLNKLITDAERLRDSFMARRDALAVEKPNIGRFFKNPNNRHLTGAGKEYIMRRKSEGASSQTIADEMTITKGRVLAWIKALS